MSTFKNAMLTLSLLALPMIALPTVAEARYMVPKYSKTATVYNAKQGHKLRAKVNSKMKVRDAKWNKAQRAKATITKKVV